MEFPRFSVVAALLVGVAGRMDAQQTTVRDGAGLPVSVPAPARRVASLMSSATEIIISLGAADRVVARTRYDTSGAVARAANMGGGIDPSVEVLLSARPDLFIAWKGQATTAVVNRMRALGVPVYLVETTDTTALFATVRDLGALLGVAPRATAAMDQLRAELRALQLQARGQPRPKAVYVISRSPVIVAAARSFMAELISVAGADNPFSDIAGDFPTLSLEAFLARDPDVLIVGRRGRGMRELDLLRAAPGWRDLRAVRNGAVVEVDGEQWGRPTLRVGGLVKDLAAQLRRLPPAALRSK